MPAEVEFTKDEIIVTSGIDDKHLFKMTVKRAVSEEGHVSRGTIVRTNKSLGTSSIQATECEIAVPRGPTIDE